MAPTDLPYHENKRIERAFDHVRNYGRINFGETGKDISEPTERLKNTEQISNLNFGRYGVVRTTNVQQKDPSQSAQAIANYLANPINTEESEGRLFFDHDKKKKRRKRKKKKKKRPCIPQKYGGRTYLPYVNLVYVEVNDNNYNPTGGYYCRPTYGNGDQGSHGIHGAHGGGLLDALFGLDDDDEEDEYDDTDDVIDDYDENLDNSHGALLVSGGLINRPVPGVGGGGASFGGYVPGDGGSGGGLAGGGGGGSVVNGGPLGFFGQGGLFDFTSANRPGVNPARPQVDDPYSDGVRPVIEINVPDTLQDVVSINKYIEIIKCL